MAPDRPRSPLRFLGVGLELGGVVAVMAWIGYGIDQWLDSRPWGIVTMALLGVTGGLYNLIKRALKELG
ncbi:MAG: AtpZ/AtpI family protein [Phycisphaerae bacterium]|nr:AtpZ/AtpI family protein [Phycisphaerae bacterium]